MKTTTVNAIEVTLHVDLVWTDPEDFAANFSYEGETRPFTSSHWLWGDLSNCRVTWHSADSDVELPYGVEAASENGLLIDVWRADLAAKRILFTADSPKDGYPGAGKTHFTLWVAQYRRDRLRLVLWEFYDVTYQEEVIDKDSGKERAEARQPEEAPDAVYAPRLLKWLTARWGAEGDAVLVLTNESAPEHPVAVPLLPFRASGADWDAWFDWYYRQPWGPIPSKLEHMAQLCGKSRSTIEDRHSLYMADKR